MMIYFIFVKKVQKAAAELYNHTKLKFYCQEFSLTQLIYIEASLITTMKGE